VTKISDTIYIIGAGAIGKALAVFLKLENKEVVIVRASVNDAADHVENIEVKLNDGERMHAVVEIKTLSSLPALEGVVVLTNKSFGNEALAKTLRKKINHCPVVILQNGLNIEQPFIDHDFSLLYRCVVFATSQESSQNKLQFRPVTISPIGIIRGDWNNLAAIVEQLDNRIFKFKVSENIQPIIWTKAIVNSVFNSVCPLLETDNGIFYRNEKALMIARRIIAEGVVIAAAKNILLDKADVERRLLLISQFSEGQLISTYQDIRNKRRTEIESLNIAISDMAIELSQEDLVKETRLLGELVLIKSALNK
jgi:2-dehydropantoate 2-reductase